MENDNQNPVSNQPQLQNYPPDPVVALPPENNIPTPNQNVVPNPIPLVLEVPQSSQNGGLKDSSLLVRLSLIFGSAALIMLLVIKIVGGQFYAQKYENIFLGLLAVSIILILVFLWCAAKEKATKILLAVLLVLFAGTYVCLYLERRYTLPIQKNEYYLAEQAKQLLGYTFDFLEEESTDTNKIQERDTKRQTDIGAMHSQLEVYFARNGEGYPILEDLSNPGWRSENMNLSDLDEEMTCDPNSSASWRCQYASEPSADIYAYQTWEEDGVTPCTGEAEHGEVCPKYTLTATLESTINGSSTYVKTSLN
jgi:Ca2+/Na+ antiporter